MDVVSSDLEKTIDLLWDDVSGIGTFIDAIQPAIVESDEKKRKVLKNAFILAFFASALDFLLLDIPVSDSDRQKQDTYFDPQPVTYEDFASIVTFTTDSYVAAAHLNVDQKITNKPDLNSVVVKAEAWSLDKGYGSTAKIISDLREMPAESTKEEVKELINGSNGIAKLNDGTARDSIVRIAVTGGVDRIVTSPIYISQFPYRIISPTHDEKVRSSHLALEGEGIDKTAIYNYRDPIWNIIVPPMYYNCRCGWAPLTVIQAANLGLKEAKDWIARSKVYGKENGTEEGESLLFTQPGTFQMSQISSSSLPQVWTERI